MKDNTHSFDLATLDLLFDAWPESYCSTCNAIESSWPSDVFESTERNFTAHDLRGQPREFRERLLDGARPDDVWLDVRCRVCGTQYFMHPPTPMPFERGDYMERLLRLSRAAKRFPPHTTYGSPRWGRHEQSHGDVSQDSNLYDALIEACEAATWRIHFMTYTIDEDILIELQALAAKNNVIVRGIVGEEHSQGEGSLAAEETAENYAVLVAKDRVSKRLYTHTNPLYS